MAASGTWLPIGVTVEWTAHFQVPANTTVSSCSSELSKNPASRRWWCSSSHRGSSAPVQLEQDGLSLNGGFSGAMACATPQDFPQRVVWIDTYVKFVEGDFLGLFIHKVYFSSPPSTQGGNAI